MNHTEFKKELLALSRRIAQTYSPGTLKTEVKMDLVRNGNSTGEISVKSHTCPTGLGDGRRCWLSFSSDNWVADHSEAKFTCFKLWRSTLSAFSEYPRKHSSYITDSNGNSESSANQAVMDQRERNS